MKVKQLQKGLTQLAEEGAVQYFRPLMGSDYILGAIGALQFDVTVARLKAEYGVDAVYEPAGFSAARWIGCDDKKKFEDFERKHLANLAHDSEGHLAYLAPNTWRLDFVIEDWPDISFKNTGSTTDEYTRKFAYHGDGRHASQGRNQGA